MQSKFNTRAGGSAKRFLDVFLDLWSDPGDVRRTRNNAGQEGRKQDLERIGGDIRKAASEILPDSNAKRG